MPTNNKVFSTDNVLTGRTQIETSFGANSDDFTIDSNNVLNLKNKTSYWSCPGNNFHPTSPDTTDHSYDANGNMSWNDTGEAHAPVFLPEGAVVTAVAVYGNADAAASAAWSLKRKDVDAESINSTMASAAVNTADSSISNATTDNTTYSYHFAVEGLDVGDKIYGARITYTTDYD